MMILRILDYVFLVKNISKKQKELCRELITHLHKLIPFYSKISKRIQSSTQSKSIIFDKNDGKENNICSPLEYYLI